MSPQRLIPKFFSLEFVVFVIVLLQLLAVAVSSAHAAPFTYL